MSDDEIITDPLFQLNLFIFLSWDGPANGLVVPIFAQSGYSLYVIEKLLTASEQIRLQIEANNVAVQLKGRPDLLFEHNEDKAFVVVECKTRSFDYTRDEARQARFFLLYTGNELATTIGKPKNETWTSILAYACSANYGEMMLATLEHLSQELVSLGFSTTPFTNIEFSRTDDGVYLQFPQSAERLPGMHNIDNPIRVMPLTPNEDPRPLYLLPYLPQGSHRNDPVAKEVLERRIRLAVAAFLGGLGSIEKRQALDALLESSIQVWNLWDNRNEKQQIKRYVRKFIRDMLRELFRKTGYLCVVDVEEIILPAASRKEIIDVRKFVQSPDFRRLPIALSGPVQLGIGEAISTEDEEPPQAEG